MTRNGPENITHKLILMALLGLVAALVFVCCRATDRGPRPGQNRNEIGRTGGKAEVPPAFPTAEQMKFENFRQPFSPNSGCSGEEFFVDVQELSPHAPVTFSVDLAKALRNVAGENICAWFGATYPPKDLGCVWSPADARWKFDEATHGAKLEVDVRTVFKAPTTAGCVVHDGHLRFFRVRFLLRQHALAAPDTSLCSIQSAISKAASDVANKVALAQQIDICNQPGAPGGRVTFDVGRECPVRTLDGVNGMPPPVLAAVGMLDWHTKQLGASGVPPAFSGVPPGVRPRVHLIDTGVYPTVESAMSVSPGQPEPLLDPHGSALAVVYRQLSPATSSGAPSADPRSEITSDKIFENYRTRTSSLAQAIEAVYRQTLKDPRPAVVNLSLGWPADLTHPKVVRPLCGGVVTVLRRGKWEMEPCVGREGPLGGAVRFALALLRFGATNASVMAAPGNQPAPSNDPTFNQTANYTGPIGTNVCGQQALDPFLVGETRQLPMFYPAQWGRPIPNEDRVNPFTRKRAGRSRLATPAGAIDQNGQRVSTTLPGRGLPLEAPGQHVYVSGDLSGAMIRVPLPPGAPMPLMSEEERRSLTVPSSWTGTSLSTVLMSASAAEAQLQWYESFGRPLTWPQTLVALHVTGTETTTRASSRKPSMCQLRTGLATKSACASTIAACVEQAPSLEEWDAYVNTASACRKARAACQRTWSSCDHQGRSEWPSGYPGASVTPVAGTASAVTPQCGPGDLCLEMSASGEIGPQPGGGYCPECEISNLLGSVGGATANLFIEISPVVDPMTEFTDFRLTIKNAAGTKFDFDVLDDSGQSLKLTGGDAVLLEIQLPGMTGDPVEVVLAAKETPPGAPKGIDVLAALRIQ